MSVTNQIPYAQFVAAPGSTTFQTGFRVILATDLVVRKDGVVITSGFTLSGLNQPSGLDVVFGVPMVGGEKIELLRRIPLTRVTDYQQLGDFLSVVVNTDFDRPWMALQELASQLQGVVRVPYPESISDVPGVAARALRVLGFDENGQPMLYAPSSAVSAAENVRITDAGNKFVSETVEGALQETVTIAAICIAVSDEVSSLTPGVGKVKFRMPHGLTLTGVKASLNTAQGSGSIFTVDINEGGVSILSTKLTIDNTETTSKTAATPAVISDNQLAEDAEITIAIDQVGNGTAAGLKVYLLGKPS